MNPNLLSQPIFAPYYPKSAAYRRYEYAEDRFQFQIWLKAEPTTFKRYWQLDEVMGSLNLYLTRQGRVLDKTLPPDFTRRGEMPCDRVFTKTIIEPIHLAISLSLSELELSNFRFVIARSLKQLRVELRARQNR